MSPSTHITAEIEAGILKLGINRPEKKNALTQAMYQSLQDALIAAKTDDAVRVVVIHGTDDTFSAGNDLLDFDRKREPGVKFPAELFLNVLHEFEKPVVAAVSGLAIGIGTTILMHCDLVYADPDTRFRMPFVNLGVVPEAASTLLLPLNAGYKKAANILMLGEFFTTREAMELDIVTKAVPARQLMSHALEKARFLAAQPHEALVLTKKLLKQTIRTQVTERIAEECIYFGQLLESEESIAARNTIKQKK